MFWPPIFFGGGGLPEFLESIYKIDTGCDHVAKFRGDRPMELGDYALKKRKHHEHFIRPPITPFGRPNKQIRKMESIQRHALKIFSGKEICSIFCYLH